MLNIHLPRYERIWLWLGGGTLAVFLIIAGVMGFYLGIHPPGQMRTIAPETVRTTPPFDQPGFYQIGPKTYRGAIIAQIFAFLPGNITIPVGSTVHFEVTSPDVIHGLEIPGTNVNMLVVPGHITEFTYTFKQSGEYLLLCNEYCGSGHQIMMAKLIVE